MKLNKKIIFSTLFLFIFISAFSSGVYSSLSDSFKTFSHYSIHKEIKQDGSFSTSSEELVFEETENDVEDSVSPEFILIPNFLNFKSISSNSIINFSEFLYSEKAFSPIFISIRALRI